MTNNPASAETAPPHYDVVVVGAGLSGIGAAHYVQSECPWATYTVFEARAAIGGTWDLFRYPGIRSDSDMYTLGFGFRPWRSDKAIADGASIREYIADTARAEGIDRQIQFHRKVVAASWSTDDARWTLTVLDTESGESTQVTCQFLFSCTGYYRYDRGHEPDFPGRDDYRGTFIHPQHWPEDLDYAGKRIVVIGSGATAVTLIPSLAAKAAHVTMLQRSPTYIMSLPDEDPVAKTMQKVLPESVSGPAIKWMKALSTQGFFRLSRRSPKMMKKAIIAGVRRQLPDGFDVERHFTPTYDPWDQRVCLVPNADLFKAIKSGKASVVTDHIDTLTADGIALTSGEFLPADIIVSATGLELLFAGGIEFTVDSEPLDPAQRFAYKGMMLEGVPNFALAMGYTNASWTLKCELTCKFVADLLNVMRRRRQRQVTPTNADPTLVAEPMLPLTSGYITRAIDKMPKQGTKAPWQTYQSYLKDFRTNRVRGDELDPALVLSNPVLPAREKPEPEKPEPEKAGVA